MWLARPQQGSAGVPAAELLLDPLRIEPAGGEQDVAVEPEVGELLDEALVRLADGRERGLDALLPHLLRGGRGAAASSSADDVRALRPRRSRARRRRARARARSTTRRRCGRPGRPGARAAGSRRRRSRRGSPRPPACCPTSRPCASTPAASGSRTRPRRVSRVRRSASSSIQASISTRPLAASCTIAGVSSPGQIRTFHPASFSSAFSSGSRSGRSCTIEATIAASAPTANASARCARLARAAGGDHRHLDRLGDRARQRRS